MLLVIGLQSVQRTGVLSYPPQYGQSVPSEIATGAVRLEDRDAMEVLLLPADCLACRAAGQVTLSVHPPWQPMGQGCRKVGELPATSRYVLGADLTFQGPLHQRCTSLERVQEALLSQECLSH